MKIEVKIDLIIMVFSFKWLLLIGYKIKVMNPLVGKKPRRGNFIKQALRSFLYILLLFHRMIY
jgi:hypothetical protein